MKTLRLAALLALFPLALATAQNARLVTVTARSQPDGSPTTNTVAVAEGEIGELLTFHVNDVGYVRIAKNDTLMNAVPATAQFAGGTAGGIGTTVKGPATFILEAFRKVGSQANQALMTVRITPEIFDVNKTVMLPPGTNQVYVGLETSTNLIQWLETTNGIYGGTNTARFFRIKLATP